MKSHYCKQEDKLGTLEEAIEFDKKRNYQYTSPTIVKDEQGKVVAVTLTNEEHQVQKVLWQAPRELSDEEINLQSWMLGYQEGKASVAIDKEILKKASEK
jgi:hypothetical protein